MNLRTTKGDPRVFDHLPEVFDSFARLFGAPLTEYLKARIPERGDRAVDLGCGTGLHATVLAAHFTDVLAVDVSVPMLDFARGRRPHANVRYEHRDLTDVSPARDGEFDVVFSAYTLHHVAGLPDVLRQIRSLVRPGGQVILIDNVDARRQVPRAWFKAEARKGFLADLRHHRRSLMQACQAYRRYTNRGLLDHFTTDVFLTPAEFESQYGEVFPGAAITSMYRARAVQWRADAKDKAGSGGV